MDTSMNPKGMAILNGPGQASAPGEAHLWVCSGKNIGRRFALDRQEHTIGRSANVEIPVVDERVSQQHAKIITGQGGHFLYDLDSTNGTYVNNERVREARLKDGDLVQVGETVFEYLSYEERKLTINVNANTAPPSDNADAVPASLRAGAQQALNRARRYEEPTPTPAPTAPRDGGTQVEAAESPVHVHRTGRGIPGSNSHVARAPQHAVASVPPQAPAPSRSNPGALGGPAVEERQAYYADDEEEGGGITIADVIEKVQLVYNFFRPYWKSILACGFVGAAIMAGIFLLNPPMKKAVFEVNLVPGITENPIGRIASGNIAFFKSAEQNFKSSSLIRKTLAEFGEPEEAITPGLIASIQERLSFASVGPPVPNTYRGSYTAPTGDDAQRYLKKHVDVYLRTEIEKTLQVIQGQVDFLRAQLAEREKELRRTEAERLEFKRKNLDGLPEQARSHYDRLFGLKQTLSDAKMQELKLNAQIAMNARRLKSEAPLVEARRLQSTPYRDELIALNRDLIKARADGKGDQHPDIIALERRKEELGRLSRTTSSDKEVERRRNPLYDAITNEIRTLEVARSASYNQRREVLKEIEKSEKLVKRLPELEARYAELTRNYGTVQELYAKIYERLQFAELQYDLEKTQAAARYDIISPVSLEYVPMRKKVMQKAGVGFGGGLVFGLILAALRELRRRPDVVTKALVKATKKPSQLQ